MRISASLFLCITPLHAYTLLIPLLSHSRHPRDSRRRIKQYRKVRQNMGLESNRLLLNFLSFFFLLFHWEVKLNRIGFLHICQTNIPGDSTALYKLHNWTHRKGWEAHSSLRGCLWRVGDTAAIGRVTVPVQWPTSPQLSLLLGVEL